MKIKHPKEKDLCSFFENLDDETLYYFSLYPNINKQSEAKIISKLILKDKNQKVFGYFIKNNMIGYGILRFFSKETKKSICNLGIVISKNFQNQGIGKELADYMIYWAKKNDYKKIWLTVYADNLKAIRFYSKLGFQPEGIFMYDEYFGNNVRNSISMALFFGHNPLNERKKIWENLSKMLVQH
jgi:RimJ/RimL family protein N-acetyltransferase